MRVGASATVWAAASGRMSHPCSPTSRAAAWCERLPCRLAAIPASGVHASQRDEPSRCHETVRLSWIHTHHESPLAACRHGDVAANHKGKTAKHLLLNHISVDGQQLAYSVRELLVIDHGSNRRGRAPSSGRRAGWTTLARRARELDGSAAPDRPLGPNGARRSRRVRRSLTAPPEPPSWSSSA